jgi:hypothetical protein
VPDIMRRGVPWGLSKILNIRLHEVVAVPLLATLNATTLRHLVPPMVGYAF